MDELIFMTFWDWSIIFTGNNLEYFGIFCLTPWIYAYVYYLDPCLLAKLQGVNGLSRHFQDMSDMTQGIIRYNILSQTRPFHVPQTRIKCGMGVTFRQVRISFHTESRRDHLRLHEGHDAVVLHKYIRCLP